MIFILSDKSFRENAKKILKVRDYVIIDGSDSGYIDDSKSASKGDISNVYNNTIINGAYTPSHRLIDAIKKESKKKDLSAEDHLPWKLQQSMDEYFESAEVVGAMLSTIKGFTMKINANSSGSDSQRNVFIVLPNRIYKYMGDQFLIRFYDLTKADFKFVYGEKDLFENMKLLRKDLKDKRIDFLDRRVEKLAKKYKLNK